MPTSASVRKEIDHRTIKLIVGVIALTLACLTSYLSSAPLASISASYYEGGWPQSIFVGFLFAIASFLLAYNGYTRAEMVLSKFAAVAALGVALFPCRCDGHDQIIPHVHAVSAAVMFLVLAYFCYGFFRRAWAKRHAEAQARAVIYGVCGIAIVLSIATLAYDRLSGGTLSASLSRLTFYGEATALVSFGISWLTASRVLPVLTRKEERFSLLRAANPD